jgi:hypothetical protein
VRFHLLGVKPGAVTEVTCELLREGQPVAQASLSATRGPQRVLLALRGPKLAPGNYDVRAVAGGRMFAASSSVRVVESPWSTP